MAESDNYLRIINDAESNPQVNKIIEAVERFNAFAESMGVPIKKKEILRSREEMKFELVTSNWRLQ